MARPEKLSSVPPVVSKLGNGASAAAASHSCLSLLCSPTAGTHSRYEGKTSVQLWLGPSAQLNLKKMTVVCHVHKCSGSSWVTASISGTGVLL